MKNPKKGKPAKTIAGLSPEDIAGELVWLSSRGAQGKPKFAQRLAALYAFAFEYDKKDMFTYLETRYGQVKPQDNQINIILSQAE